MTQNNSLHLPPGVVVTDNSAEMPTYSTDRTLKVPLRRLNGAIDMVLLRQSTRGGQDTVVSVPDALGMPTETQIGLSRASRIVSNSPAPSIAPPPPVECSLCNAARSGADRPSLEVDNIRPFGPLLHKVVFSKAHIQSLATIDLALLRDALEQFREIGLEASAAPQARIDGLAIGMNFGDYLWSGASQIHFHYQVTGIGSANGNAGDRLGDLCRAYKTATNEDYLADYEIALRRAGMVIAEASNGLAFAYAPISPRFKGEVQIMLKKRNRGRQPGNILDTTAPERDALAELQHDIMCRFHSRGCAALNQLWYATRFSDENAWGQRLIICMCPRTAIVAFYELLGNSVIDLFPWVAAEGLRTSQLSLRA